MHKITALIAFTALMLACDAAEQTEDLACPVGGEGDLIAAEPLRLAGPVDGPPAFEISFRKQGPPQALYTTTWDGKPIHREQVVSIVEHCALQVDPPQTCTLSWYQPDTSQPTFVVGLGCSFMASWELFSCYRDGFLKNDAKPI